MRRAYLLLFIGLAGLVAAYGRVAWAVDADVTSVSWLVVMDDWLTRVTLGVMVALQVGPKLLEKLGLTKSTEPAEALPVDTAAGWTQNQIRAIIREEISPVVVERDAQHKRVNEKIDGLQKDQEKALAAQHAWQLEVSRNIGKLMGKLGIE